MNFPNFLQRGLTWDVAMTRCTCILDLPQIGIVKNKKISLVFYDGGECVRKLEEHDKANKRPRGYSCEELGGLAYFENNNFSNITRISKLAPLFISPNGTGCSRYVSITEMEKGYFVIWQQS